MKKLIIVMLLFSCETEDPGKPSEYFITDEQEQTIDDYSYQEESNSSPAIDYRVPLCPAHPEGAKVTSGLKDFFSGDEHSGCTTEHCIKDLKAEKKRRQQQKTFEDLKNELGY